MVLNDLVDSFCYSQKNARLKGLMVPDCVEFVLYKRLVLHVGLLYRLHSMPLHT